MRVLHCMPNMLNGGAQRQLAYLAEEQLTRRLDVHVALLHEGPNFGRLRGGGAIVHRFVGRNNYDPRIILQLVRLIRQTKPDVVQTWLNQMDVFGGLAALMIHVPWVLSERSSSGAYPPTVKNRLRAKIGARAQAIISNSWGGDEYWKGRAGGSVRRYVIPNAVPVEEIERFPAVTSATIGLDSDDKMVLYVGRLSPEKNLANLIPALRDATRRKKLAIFFCGDGTHRTWTEDLVRAHGLSNRVRFTGYIPNVWGWMKRADVFVSVSRFEGCPNAVLEAMACGCKLVLSDIPAHREVVSEDGASFVDPDAPLEIADAIIRSLEEPSNRTYQPHLIKDWSAGEVARRHDQVYEDVVASFRGR